MQASSPERTRPVSARAKSAAAVTVAMERAGVEVNALEELTGLADQLFDRLTARSAFTVNELDAIAGALDVNVLSLLEAPQFTCPEWCEIGHEQHLSQLWDQGGQYQHRPVEHEVVDTSLRSGETKTVGLAVYTDAEGRPAEMSFVVGDMVFDRAEAAKLVEAFSHYLTITEP